MPSSKEKTVFSSKNKIQKPAYLSKSGTGEKYILAISDKLLGLSSKSYNMYITAKSPYFQISSHYI